MPWDLQALNKTPAFEWGGEKDGIKSLVYTGLPYKGRQTKGFAYYAVPKAKKSDKTGKLPGIVLVHGGGGRAFPHWAKKWADRGYAAIAMDTSGKYVPKKDAGPPGWGGFSQLDDPITDQWPYHAVADVILAHSLIRSFPEVDKDRIVITGISWGGYLTCICASLDKRFAAAVPVYACGFRYLNNSRSRPSHGITASQKQEWAMLWDPSRYLGAATVPMFFVNGTSDGFCKLRSYHRTYSLVKDRNLRMTVGMEHSHVHGWAPVEIGLFVDQYCKAGTPLPKIDTPVLLAGLVRARVNSETSLRDAALWYSTSPGPYHRTKGRNPAGFHRLSANILNDVILAGEPPENTKVWFLTVTDNRRATVSSEVVFEE